MISGISVGICIFAASMCSQKMTEIHLSDKSSPEAIINSYLTEHTIFRGTIIIALLGWLSAEVSIQMPFLDGLLFMILGFGGLSIMVANQMIKNLESSLYTEKR